MPVMLDTWMLNVQCSSVIFAPLCSYSIRFCSPKCIVYWKCEQSTNDEHHTTVNGIQLVPLKRWMKNTYNNNKNNNKIHTIYRLKYIVLIFHSSANHFSMILIRLLFRKHCFYIFYSMCMLCLLSIFRLYFLILYFAYFHSVLFILTSNQIKSKRIVKCLVFAFKTCITC